jgi:hypothetical protein
MLFLSRSDLLVPEFPPFMIDVCEVDSSSLTPPPRRLVGNGQCAACQGESIPDKLRPGNCNPPNNTPPPGHSSLTLAAAPRWLDVEGDTLPRGSQHQSSHAGPFLTPPRLALSAPTPPAEAHTPVGRRGHHDRASSSRPPLFRDPYKKDHMPSVHTSTDSFCSPVSRNHTSPVPLAVARHRPAASRLPHQRA